MLPSSWKNFTVAAALALTAAGGLIATLLFARSQRTQPQRCPPGLVAMGPRCCGHGQRVEGGRCVGRPSACGINMRVTESGCVATTQRVLVSGGNFVVSVADWEANMTTGQRTVSLKSFRIDSQEVSTLDWNHCADGGRCDRRDAEPGRPVWGVTPKQAAQFCTWASGRLPSVDEWRAAAMGTEARRFPWGPTGLVCRRASFGLVDGPCGHGADGPELAGARPGGATPSGIHDLAGNVAEWAIGADGSAVAMGGSFASRLAAELKPAAYPLERPNPEQVGFRCVYPEG
ncbi:MAG TPA: SUMF1/EgtB/PvdO family nonheme iron enzyme [Polyangiaceae bacterium]|nr:SUMF1/EgtB/PvdO family nonheme iron enzyme [Polyangiaceae bacterium]